MSNYIKIKPKYFVKSVSSNGIIKNQASDVYIDGYYPAYSASGQDVWLPNKEFTREGIVISAVGARCGKCFLTEKEWATCANTHVLFVDERMCLRRYFWYICNDEDWWEKGGTAQPFVAVKKSLDKWIYLPSLDIQKQIINFLDKKTKQIESLIASQEKQIEKLKAYKQSLIFDVVTKGIDSTVTLTESGVPWLGKICDRYSVSNIGKLFKIEKRIIGHTPDTVLSITQQGIRVKDINSNEGQNAESYDNYQIVHVGDFAMNHMDLLTGWVDISSFEGVTSPDYRVFTIKDSQMEKRYFLYLFQSYYKNKVFYAFGQGAANLGRWRLPAKNFKNIAIIIPPVEEQQQIVSFLDKKCAIIDQLIAIKLRKIEKLQTYKKSLIYEYVTGKKEVV